MPDTDILVIGSGIAGLSYALKVHELLPAARITIVTKDKLQLSGSQFAQGGVAAVTDFENDSYEQHIADTLAAGDGLCDRQVVDFVVREATARVLELGRWDVRFDKNSHGGFDLAREGGHSARRILHTADCTGAEIMQKLAAAARTVPQISILEAHFATDLVCSDNICRGAWVLAPGCTQPQPVYARATMIATGGLGQVFLHTTNPEVCTGDGIAMAWRAGARIADMEFIQFHPTALWQSGPGTSFLISEAVRGAGAILRNQQGERFMERYDPRLELATRDVVARAVQNEMRSTGADRVYLDCTAIPRTYFSSHFPAILARCLVAGIDPRETPIPVTTSAHYCCGGIATDHHGRTSVENLYAAGESARTGLHGGNRLASNSLLEALVFAHRAAEATAGSLPTRIAGEASTQFKNTLPRPAGPFSLQTKLLREKMSAASIIIRDEPLEDALSLVRFLRGSFAPATCGTQSAESVTYGNLLDAAWLILTAWANRESNGGAFFRERSALVA